MAMWEDFETSFVEFGESEHYRPVGENDAMRGGDQRMLHSVYMNHHERSCAAFFLAPDGVKRRRHVSEFYGN